MPNEKLITKYFISIETIIYITFILLDLLGKTPFLSDLFKYSGILLAAGYAFRLFIKYSGPDRIIVSFALFFTAIADLFLLFFSDNILMMITGLVSFSAVQTLYAIRTTKGNRRNIRVLIPCLTMIVSVCLSALIDSLLCYDISAAVLVALVLYYSITFAMNTVRSFIIYRRTALRSNLLFALGMTLFVLCDINILIRHLNTFFFGIVPSEMVSAAVFLSWVFYLPAQVLIALCCKPSEDIGARGSQP